MLPGGVIVGVTMLRARVLARAIGWVLIVTSVLSAPLNFIDPNGLLGTVLMNANLVLFYASLAWAGAALSLRRNPTQVTASSVQQN
jgi:hypothetical protein